MALRFRVQVAELCNLIQTANRGEVERGQMAPTTIDLNRLGQAPLLGSGERSQSSIVFLGRMTPNSLA